ncbi:MAG: transposase, partial [Nitrospiraceae bacterium]
GEPAAQRLLSEWPIERPSQWVQWVNQPESPEELATLRQSVVRGQPFGQSRWVERMVDRFGLASTLRPQGRPRRPDHENGSCVHSRS